MMFPRFIVGATVLAVLSSSAMAQLSGAIFTTNKNATIVDANIYKFKKDVYLNGGPKPSAPCTAAGLPDGKYYFQVTDPSGKTLLSEDDIDCRVAVVSGGKIVAHEATPASCLHNTGTGPCPGSVTIQLIPYADTPNPGGEYKAWMTPVDEYKPGEGFHGFIPRWSKTDNFKVKKGKPEPNGKISGIKYYDTNCDGDRDAGEPPIPGWRIEIWIGNTLDGVTFTDGDGKYCFIRKIDDTVYTIKEVPPPPGFLPAPGAVWKNCTATSGDVVVNAEQVAGPAFGNVCFVTKTGLGLTKGFWHNQNGKAVLATCDDEWRKVLNALCLRTNDTDPSKSSIFTLGLLPGTSFDAAHQALADWIVGDPAYGVGAFIMSTQLAALALNHACGNLQGDVFVVVDSQVLSLDELIALGVSLLKDSGANDTGPQGSEQELRAAMLALSSIYDSINSNSRPVLVVSSTPCPFSDGYGEL